MFRYPRDVNSTWGKQGTPPAGVQQTWKTREQFADIGFEVEQIALLFLRTVGNKNSNQVNNSDKHTSNTSISANRNQPDYVTGRRIYS